MIVHDDDGPIFRSSATTRRSSSPNPKSHRAAAYGTLVAAFGVAALLGVGVLAVTSVFGSGGAGSPEGAVRQLADAISHKDPLAAVDVLVADRSAFDARHREARDATRAADLKIVERRERTARGRGPLRRPLEALDRERWPTATRR